MKKRITKNTREYQITRRELVGGAMAAAGGVITGAPAFLRGQNLNNKLNIAMIACGGRANANVNGDGGSRRGLASEENRTAETEEKRRPAAHQVGSHAGYFADDRPAEKSIAGVLRIRGGDESPGARSKKKTVRKKSRCDRSQRCVEK